MMTMSKKIFLMAGLLAAVFGCDKAPSISELELRERTSRLYTNAMDDLQSGRLDAAIKGFEKVVVHEPTSYSAHFQLATLLQDVRKDYITAIAHYRNYLALRPASDKATVAQERVKLCEQLLSAEVLRKAGGSVSAKLTADNERLSAANAELSAKVKNLEGELAKAKRDIMRLEQEGASKSKMLSKLSEAGDERSPSKSVIQEALAMLKLDKEGKQRRRINPTDAELLDEEDEDATEPKNPLSASAELKNIKGELDALEAEPAPPVPEQTADGKKPQSLDAVLSGAKKKHKSSAATRPETYTVQEGDTLFKISTRFYGTANKWHAIRDANKAEISPDGRIRAGQVIRLP